MTRTDRVSEFRGFLDRVTPEGLHEHLHEHLGQDVQIARVTGHQGAEEREANIAEIEAERARVLVAADCLCERLDLRDRLTAAVRLANLRRFSACGTRGGSGFTEGRSRGGSRW